MDKQKTYNTVSKMDREFLDPADKTNVIGFFSQKEYHETRRRILQLCNLTEQNLIDGDLTPMKSLGEMLVK